MQRVTLGTALAALLVSSVASAHDVLFVRAQRDLEVAMAGSIRLPQAALADGKPLSAGTYQVRLTTEHPMPAVGQSPNAECWVEFVKAGAVVGREVATVIGEEDIATVAKGSGPKPNASRVDALKGGEYVRIWINHANTNYIINLPVLH